MPKLLKQTLAVVALFGAASFVTVSSASAQSGSLGGTPTLRHASNRTLKMSEVSPLYGPPPRQKVYQPQDIVYVNVKTDWGYSTTANQQRKRKIETEARLTYWFKLPKLFGMPVASDKVLPEIGGELDHKTQNNAGMLRKETLNFQVACRVMSVEENGNLVIEGTQKIRVDEENKIIYVGGTVRPEDIVGNKIDSSMVADLVTENFTEGSVTDTVRRPWGTKMVERFKPF